MRLPDPSVVAAARASATDHGFLGILGIRMVIGVPFWPSGPAGGGGPPEWCWQDLFLKQ
jgi:hypothetical protein